MRRVLWSLGALAGVVLAAGVAYAASSLSTQQVGLSAEPPSAGAELAPAATPTATRTPRPRPKRTPRPRRPKRTPAPRLTATAVPRVVATAAPTAVRTAVPTATTDDHGGRDDSSGRGSGKGDDRRDD
jgi:hypothetical protein